MAIKYNTSIVRNGLVLHLDAANKKSTRYSGNVNLLTDSENIATWVASAAGTEVTANAITAPDGTLTADKVYENTNASSIHIFSKTSLLTTGLSHKVSFFAKAAERYIVGCGSNNALGSCVIDLNTQTVLSGTATIIPWGDGWYRILTTVTPGGGRGVYMGIFDNAGSNVYTGDGSSGLYVWGVQAELSSTWTDYYSVLELSRWYDLSGNGNTGIISSPTFNSANNGSFVFNGVSDYIDCGGSASIKPTTAITVNAWIKFVSVPSNSRILSDWHQAGVAGDRWIFYCSNTTSVNWYMTSTVTGEIGTPESYTFTPGVWVNLTGTYDGAAQTLHVNGQSFSSRVRTGTLYPGNSSQTIRIGKQAESGGYLNGNISTVQIYNRALSATEVAQNFEAMRSRYGV